MTILKLKTMVNAPISIACNIPSAGGLDTLDFSTIRNFSRAVVKCASPNDSYVILGVPPMAGVPQGVKSSFARTGEITLYPETGVVQFEINQPIVLSCRSVSLGTVPPVVCEGFLLVDIYLNNG